MKPLRASVLLGAVLVGCAGNNPSSEGHRASSAGQSGAGASAGRPSGGLGGGPSLAGATGAAPDGGSSVGGLSGAIGTAGTSGGGAAGLGGTGAAGGRGGRGGGGGRPGVAGMTGGAGVAGTALGGAGGAPRGGNGGFGGGVSSAGASGAGTSTNVTAWLAGDSTMADGETPCPVGWGKEFARYFDGKVTVKNSAVGGRSIRTWLYNVGDTMDQTGECVLEVDSSGQPTVQARWTQMLAGMKTGDYLFIQFGINDGDPSCDRHVGIDAFEESLGVMAQAAKDHGTQPIFLTPVSAIACNGNAAKGTRGAYVTATIDAGMQFGVPVIDLHALSVALYTSLGFCPIPGGDVSASTTGPVGDFFCDDHTHFEAAGAVEIAGLVAGALRDQNIGLASHLE